MRKLAKILNFIEIFYSTRNFHSMFFCFFLDTYPGNSGESFLSSDISLDGTEAAFDIGENENTAPENSHQSSTHSHHAASTHDTATLSQSLHAAMHNPIDKLFMMQSSYFSSDHL